MHNLLILEWNTLQFPFHNEAGSQYKVIYMKEIKMQIPFVYDKCLWNVGNYGKIILKLLSLKTWNEKVLSSTLCGMMVTFE